jgi:hypothetical protein
MVMHSDDSTEVGQGGTLDQDLRPGVQGHWEARELWDQVYRTKHITHRELKTVTDNIHAFTQQLKDHQVRELSL